MNEKLKINDTPKFEVASVFGHEKITISCKINNKISFSNPQPDLYGSNAGCRSFHSYNEFQLKYPAKLDVGKKAFRFQQIQKTQKLFYQQCTDFCLPTVMLVDDNPFNLIPLEGILNQNLGISSVSFENGFDAISCFQRRLLAKCCNRHFKLILTDIQMPQIDGFKLTTLIKSIESIWHPEFKKLNDMREAKALNPVPIVAITANDIDSI